jgi:two-component system KDP operon response regulator KdpE
LNALILVIEDDHAIRNLITTTLSSFGYNYRIAADGAKAIVEAVSAQPDLFILDLGLPDMDGMEIIGKLRTWTQNPIIVVSARSEVDDKIQALDAGADDYLTKPFSVEELLVRVRVALRKKNYSQTTDSASTFVNGGLTIDYAAGCVFVDGREVHVTPMEYKLLTLLAQNVGKVLTHNFILNKVWESTIETDTQSLRVFMATLRKKIEKNTANPVYLQTHVGIGYRMMRLTD